MNIFANEEVSRYEDFQLQAVEEVEEGLSDLKDMDNRMAVVLKEIRGDCDERNTASPKLLERPGFESIETVGGAYKEDADGNPIMIRSKVYKLTV